MKNAGTAWVVGSLNVDTTFEVEHLVRPGQTILARGITRSPGGKGLNQAVAAARHGGGTRMIGATGSDEKATLLRAAMAAGDAFVGTLAAARARGTALHAACEEASAAAAIVCTVPGAFAAEPGTILSPA